LCALSYLWILLLSSRLTIHCSTKNPKLMKQTFITAGQLSDGNQQFVRFIVSHCNSLIFSVSLRLVFLRLPQLTIFSSNFFFPLANSFIGTPICFVVSEGPGEPFLNTCYRIQRFRDKFNAQPYRLSKILFSCFVQYFRYDPL